MKSKSLKLALLCAAVLFVLFGANPNFAVENQEIKIYEKNPWYWQYQGKPILLRGGSNDDNPYQWEKDELIKELDLIASVGGNYMRNTMSDRDEGNIYAFKKVGEKYDLTKWNDE